MTVDLLTKTIAGPNGIVFAFHMNESDHQSLINGWDEIDMIHATHNVEIQQFEASYRQRRPWQFRGEPNV